MWCIIDFGGFWTFLKDVTPSLAWLTGLIFAFLGLRTWRAQMTGKDQYEVAKNLLKTIYHVREKIGYLRSPMMLSGEIEAGMRKHFPDHKLDYSNQTEEDKKRIERAVMTERWSEVKEVLLQYRVIKFEAQVHWGKSIEEAFRKFERIVNSLKVKVDMLPRLDSRGGDNAKEKFSNYIFNLGDEATDEFGNDFNAAIAEIETIIRPALK